MTITITGNIIIQICQYVYEKILRFINLSKVFNAVAIKCKYKEIDMFNTLLADKLKPNKYYK